MSQTDKNLKDAFSGESQASQKYLSFAKKADAEGFRNVAKLFRAASQAETIHAAGHLLAAGGISSTAENLAAAIAGETYEYKEMYPPMLEAALKEKHRARVMFDYALKAEQVHAQLYQKALEAVKAGKDLDTPFYLCPVCGHIEMGQPPVECPICGAKKERYVQVA